MKLKFTPQFLKQLDGLNKFEKKTAERVIILIEAIEENPFEGIGKPEKLKYRENTYSRRITSKHRLVYYVEGDEITFLQCRYHYGK